MTTDIPEPRMSAAGLYQGRTYSVRRDLHPNATGYLVVERTGRKERVVRVEFDAETANRAAERLDNPRS